MATLYITFSRVGSRQAQPAPIAQGGPVRTEVLTIPVTSDGADESSLAALETDDHVELYADGDCWIEIGSSPEAAAIAASATGDSRFLPSGTPREFSVVEGDKVSVIEAQ